MKFIKKIFLHIWGAWFYFLLASFFFVLYPIFLVTLSNPKLYPIAHSARRFWGYTILYLAGIFPKIEREEPFDRSRNYIYCSNHSSYLDIPMMVYVFPGFFNYMAKSELADIPIFGRFFRTIDISVKRTSNKDSYKAFEMAAEHVNKGHSIVLFPEGTIPATAPVMKKFKNGPFKLAIENKIPIIPVTFADSHRFLPDDGTFRGRPGRLRVFVHKTIETKNMSLDQTEELSKKVYSLIHDKLEEYGVIK